MAMFHAFGRKTRPQPTNHTNRHKRSGTGFLPVDDCAFWRTRRCDSPALSPTSGCHSVS